MTDVNEASDVDTSSKKGKKKAASTSTTPTASRETSLLSLVAKLTPSDKKKQKADMKKLKVTFGTEVVNVGPFVLSYYQLDSLKQILRKYPWSHLLKWNKIQNHYT